MISNFNALLIACTISITSAFCLASSAEYNARLAAADLVLKQNNTMQQQFYNERESMKEYVSKLIDRNKRSLSTGAN
jgi:phosphoribosylcarboxyaminoimidazole (NCAIR) mutase